MLYKTITLELLQDHPQIYNQLLKTRMLLSALDTYASELRSRHLTWKDLLGEAKPGRVPSQIESEAMELAIGEMARRLPSGQLQNEPLSLDGAMAFISHYSSPA